MICIILSSIILTGPRVKMIWDKMIGAKLLKLFPGRCYRNLTNDELAHNAAPEPTYIFACHIFALCGVGKKLQAKI